MTDDKSVTMTPAQPGYTLLIARFDERGSLGIERRHIVAWRIAEYLDDDGTPEFRCAEPVVVGDDADCGQQNKPVFATAVRCPDGSVKATSGEGAWGRDVDWEKQVHTDARESADG